jgi:hypothetical protein
MARLTIFAVAVAALLGAAAGVLRSHSLLANGPAGNGGMPSVQELHSAVGTDKLPVQEFEDHSMEFSREAKR